MAVCQQNSGNGVGTQSESSHLSEERLARGLSAGINEHQNADSFEHALYNDHPRAACTMRYLTSVFAGPVPSAREKTES
jgi:hypothetical protein